MQSEKINQIVDDHANSLYFFALARVNDTSIAEDLVQETFLSAVKSLERFESKSELKTWLIGILKHKIMDYYRKSSREKDFLQDTSDNPDILFDNKGHWLAPVADWSQDPDKYLENKEFLAVFKECVKTLPRVFKRIFLMHEVDGISGKDICKVFKLSSTNYWVKLYRMRMRLRACLETNWFNKS